MQTNQKNHIPAKALLHPLYQKQERNAVLTVWPVFRRGGVIIKIQTDAEDDSKTRKLQCQAKIRDFSRLDYAAPAGTVLMEAVDVISPEKCQQLNYREDGKGYTRRLTVTSIGHEEIQIDICCTLCVQNEDGSLSRWGKYSHTESITLRTADVRQMAKAICAAYQAHLEALSQPAPAKRQRHPRAERGLEVQYAG